MKWIIGILVLIVVGWQAAVFFVNRNEVEKQSLVSTDSLQAKQPIDSVRHDSVKAGTDLDTIQKNHLPLPEGSIDTKSVQPKQVVDFAKTLIGVPYLYGSTDPAKGFDCSGFITYVFKHFDIAVPRSSIDFTNVGREVSAAQAAEGDLILFTGTDSAEKFVGHMGIVVSNSDTLRFIHSTSGKQYGVTITPLNNYYKGRYVKTVRIFP
ncbi:MAG: NlpC/P60 family protein [Chitinophagaceae bacterium]|nr:MAG: NlpC/P60 family protein [Chitinophagaceae bacterium]